ncbi:dol-P-Glc:Glc(2)Man(9)GlcNAc(2)-PP-Dol alpha-1,2-glucosyltransferase-like isoform X1 [Diadema antillarum]|uniref:dol-P-Glc:Glc(2)Man(9)GlcNAc(2)-PP-Dol alpha-1,2-glucosyltransferase-like isoform X1 n=1 Tax=Diadema antillarum TaxID=105358 RepID=UPI003A84389B
MAQFSDVFVFFVASVHVAVTLMIFMEVDKTQPSPYMDEIFHIPQAQLYCNGSFTEWNPKITTLPGLYLSSVGLLKPLALLLEADLVDLCSVTTLRSINILFAVGCLFIIYHTLCVIHCPNTKTEEIKIILTSVSLASFPLLYFFVFLYYTDVGSTFFILLAHLFCLRGNHLMASILAADAIIFRQTNVVWVIFMAGITLARLIDLTAKHKPQTSETVLGAITSSVSRGVEFISSLTNIFKAAAQLWPYALVTLGFMVFVFVNKGIVVGDRDNHQAAFNAPQLFYFAAFTAGLAFPFTVSVGKLVRFVKSLFQHPLTYIVIVGMMVVFIHRFTFVHPFLLADNRHIVFYIWHRVFMRHEYVKFALIPGYLFAGWTIRDSLSHKGELWQLVYFVCLLAATMPQQLLEFRYFIIPYLLFRINTNIQSYFQIVLEFVLYSVVNMGTLYLFLHKPFYWPNNPDEQRFLW